MAEKVAAQVAVEASMVAKARARARHASTVVWLVMCSGLAPSRWGQRMVTGSSIQQIFNRVHRGSRRDRRCESGGVGKFFRGE